MSDSRMYTIKAISLSGPVYPSYVEGFAERRQLEKQSRHELSLRFQLHPATFTVTFCVVLLSVTIARHLRASTLKQEMVFVSHSFEGFSWRLGGPRHFWASGKAAYHQESTGQNKMMSIAQPGGGSKRWRRQWVSISLQEHSTGDLTSPLGALNVSLPFKSAQLKLSLQHKGL